MGVETVLFKSKEKKSSSEVATILRQVADKVEAGKMKLKQGNRETALDFPRNMIMKIKVENDQGRRLKKSLELEIDWYAGDENDNSASIL